MEPTAPDLPPEMWAHILSFVQEPQKTTPISHTWNALTKLSFTELFKSYECSPSLKAYVERAKHLDSLPGARHDAIRVKTTFQSVMGQAKSLGWQESPIQKQQSSALSVQHLEEMARFIENVNLIIFFNAIASRVPQAKTFLNSLPRHLSKQNKATQIRTWMNQASNLTDLQHLYLSKTPLNALPPEIGNLTNLQGLYLSKTSITALPPEIGNLTNLHNLDLSYTPLTTLPPEIGKLTNLQTLVLNQTPLTALPPEIGNLTHLQHLYLAQTPITALPPEIVNLTNLQDLGLSQTSITALPPDIGKLTHLEYLNLSKTPLTALPLEISKRPGLKIVR